MLLSFQLSFSFSWARTGDSSVQALYPLPPQFEQSITRLGRIIPDTEIPEWYRFLNPGLKVLTQGQQKHFSTYTSTSFKDKDGRDYRGPITATESHLYILDSSIINAFVFSHVDGPGKLVNFVFVTTGFLRAQGVVEEEPGGGQVFVSDFSAVGGILAHELGHPLDDARKIWNTFQIPFLKRMNSQVSEYNTDRIARLILRYAHVRESSLLEAFLSILLEKPTADIDDADGLGAFAATHPNEVARVAYNMLLLTMGRFDEGLAEVDPLAFSVSPELGQKLKSEIEKFQFPEPAAGSGTVFLRTRDINEAFEKIAETAAPDGNKAALSLQLFNHYVLELYSHLQRLSVAEAQEYVPRLLDLYDQMADAYMFYQGFKKMNEVRGRPSWALGESGYEKRFRQLHPEDFHDLSETVPLFHSPEFLSAVRGRLESQRVKLKSELDETRSQYIGAFLYFVPSTVVSRVFEHEILERTKGAAAKDAMDLLKRLSLDDQVRVGRRYWDQVFVPMNAVQQFRHLFAFRHQGPFYAAYSLPFPTTSRKVTSRLKVDPYSEGRVVHTLATTRGELAARNRAVEEIFARPDLAEDRTALGAHLWRSRGLLALSEIPLATGTARTDWKFVFQSQGISDWNEGFRQVKAGLIEFLRSEAYYQIAKHSQTPLSWGESISHINTERITLGWADPSLIAELRGDHNPWLMADPEAANLARVQFVYPFIRRNPEMMAKVLGDRVLAALNDPFVHVDQIDPQALMVRILNEEIGPRVFESERRYETTTNRDGSTSRKLVEEVEHRLGDFRGVPLQMWAVAVDRSGLHPLQKQTLLHKVYRKQGDEDSISHRGWASGPGGRRIYQILRKYNVVETAGEVLNQAHSNSDNIDRSYSNLESDLERDLRKSAAEGAAPFEAMVKSVFGGLKGRGGNPAVVRLQKVTLDLWSQMSLDLNTAQNIFETVARAATSAQVDQYFVRILKDRWTKGQTGTWRKVESAHYIGWQPLLSPGVLYSATLRLELTKVWFNAYFSQLKDVRDFNNWFLGHVAEAVPETSLAKDDFIEELAWRLNINSLEELERVEAKKGFGDQSRVSAKSVNTISLLTEYAQVLSRSQIESLIQHMLKPKEVPFPRDVEAVIRKLVLQDLSRTGVWYRLYGQLFGENRSREESADRAVDQIKTITSDLQGFENLPVFLVLLLSGQQPLYRQSDFRTHILTQFLNADLEDRRTKWLMSYMDSIPKHEPAVVLAYALMKARDSGGNGTIDFADIFEMFQTVGKKGGQNSDTFGLFEDADGASRISEEEKARLRNLKDRARPMSKYRLLLTLKRELAPELFEQIVDIGEASLAAASIKTIVRAHLKNGQTIVFAIQAAHAEPQIRTHMQVAMKVVEVAHSRHLVADDEYPFLQLLMNYGEKQMVRELDTAAEAERLGQAAKIFADVTTDLSAHLNGWTLATPQTVPGWPVTKRIIPMTEAHGIALDQIQDSALKKWIGEIVIRAYLVAFFKYGWLDSDRHIGNQLVSIQGTTIYVLDVAQAQQFDVSPSPLKSDDRILLGDFVLGFLRKDALEVYEAMLKMSESKEPVTTATRQAILQQLQSVLQDQGQQQPLRLRFKALLQVFVNHGVRPQEKYLMGLFKGILTLFNEKYVDATTFGSLLQDHLQKLYTSKPLQGLSQRRRGIPELNLEDPCRIGLAP